MKQGKVTLGQADTVASELVGLLKSACERIIVAGSIRRRQPEVSDIELLVIPRANYLDKLLYELMMRNVLAMRLNKRGSRTYGPKNKLMVHIPSGIGVDIFSTSEECWPVALVVRTGGKITNQRIAMAAIKKGWHLQAYGAGFTTPQGDIICKSERDVFELVGLPYKEPWEREVVWAGSAGWGALK